MMQMSVSRCEVVIDLLQLDGHEPVYVYSYLWQHPLMAADLPAQGSVELLDTLEIRNQSDAWIAAAISSLLWVMLEQRERWKDRSEVNLLIARQKFLSEITDRAKISDHLGQSCARLLALCTGSNPVCPFRIRYSESDTLSLENRSRRLEAMRQAAWDLQVLQAHPDYCVDVPAWKQGHLVGGI